MRRTSYEIVDWGGTFRYRVAHTSFSVMAVRWYRFCLRASKMCSLDIIPYRVSAYLHPAEIQFECGARCSSTARLDLRESSQLRDLIVRERERMWTIIKKSEINACENGRNCASGRMETRSVTFAVIVQYLMLGWSFVLVTARKADVE